MTAGDEQTCNASTGSKQNDYLIVSIDLAPFIQNLQIEADVSWSPHVALSFEVDRRPGKTFHQTLVRPAEIPYAKDDKGTATRWSIDKEEWGAKLQSKQKKAERAIDATKDDDPGTW